jgi:hypothetical protein
LTIDGAAAKQLEMKLRPAPRWGGWREKAGRKRDPKSGMRHTSREGFSSTTPAHVTVKLMPDLLSLRNKQLVRALERTFAAGCDRSEFRLVHYSLLGNHAHPIVEARDQHALGRGMMAIGSRLALAVNRVMKRKKARRVMEVVLDPASSARWFEGWKRGSGPVPRAAVSAAGHDRPPVARARTWLLTVGWRRHGLLDPVDVPG